MHYLDPPLRRLPLDPPLRQRLQRYQLWILIRYSVNYSNTESSIKNLRRINLKKYQISQVFWIKSSKCEYISYFIGTWPVIIVDLIIFHQGVIHLTPCFHHNIYRLKCFILSLDTLAHGRLLITNGLSLISRTVDSCLNLSFSVSSLT